MARRVRVRVGQTGKHDAPDGVDVPRVRGHGKRGANGDDTVALDEDVGARESGRGAAEHLSAANQQRHDVPQSPRYFFCGRRSFV